MTCVALENTASISRDTIGSVGMSGSITRLTKKCFCLAMGVTAGGETNRVEGSKWLVEHLLEAEDTNREMRSISHQMKSARFPLHRDLAGFDFAASQVDKAQPSGATSGCSRSN